MTLERGHFGTIKQRSNCCWQPMTVCVNVTGSVIISNYHHHNNPPPATAKQLLCRTSPPPPPPPTPTSTPSSLLRHIKREKLWKPWTGVRREGRGQGGLEPWPPKQTICWFNIQSPAAQPSTLPFPYDHYISNISLSSFPHERMSLPTPSTDKRIFSAYLISTIFT